jgi:hypothetical protein
MTPTEMEMRVARALKDETGLLIAPSFWDKCAKIAIRAMREPTQEMFSAAVGVNCYLDASAGVTIEQWTAMIDAASPPQETKP